MNIRFDDKVALVTGSSKGIGRAAAIEFARSGASVVVNYNTDKAGADSAVEEIEQLGSRAVALQADVSSVADVKRMMEERLHAVTIPIASSSTGSSPIPHAIWPPYC